MTPALPRRAATVLVLRRSSQAAQSAGQTDGHTDDLIEVLMVRRSRKATFMANSYVFPGGRVDEVDYHRGPELASRLAAARELREEVGIDLGQPERLPFFSHWITPSVEPRRFDTDFFLAELPPGQEPRVDAQEVFDLLWLTPAEALRRYAAGELMLPPPTVANLQDLQELLAQVVGQGTGGTAGEGAGCPQGLIARLVEACRDRRPQPVLPKVVADRESGGIAIVLPWDPDYDSLPGEGEPLPAAVGEHRPPPAYSLPLPRASRFVLTPEGKWQKGSGGNWPASS